MQARSGDLDKCQKCGGSGLMADELCDPDYGVWPVPCDCRAVVKDSLTTERVRNPYKITDEMESAGWSAYEQYQEWVKDKKFPRPTLIDHIYLSMRSMEPRT